MGGHGGLNILPQKRWNVYNYDNRAKVERDKRKLHEKRNQKMDEDMKNESTSRLKRIREERIEGGHKSKDGEGQGVSQAIKRHKEFIDRNEQKELKVVKKRDNVNLFAAEEEMQNKEKQKLIDMQSQKFFEGKPFEMDTKFGGNFKNQPPVPWYTQVQKTDESNKQEESEEQKKQSAVKRQIDSFRNTKSISLFKVLDLENEGKHKAKDNSWRHKGESSPTTQRNEDNHKRDRKKHKRNRSSSSSCSSERKQKKTPKISKKIRKEQEEERAKQDKLQKLREERIKRERQESQKKRELLRVNHLI